MPEKAAFFHFYSAFCLIPGEISGLTVVCRSNLLHSPNYVLLLGIFKTWHKEWGHLQSVGSYKYNFSVALTISFFLSGVLSLHSNPNRCLVFWNLFVREELVILMCPVLIMSILMGMMVYSSSKEKTLRDLLIQISDMV